jgi:hypothetical protein
VASVFESHVECRRRRRREEEEESSSALRVVT